MIIIRRRSKRSTYTPETTENSSVGTVTTIMRVANATVDPVNRCTRNMSDRKVRLSPKSEPTCASHK